jgi:hypothetical protein
LGLCPGLLVKDSKVKEEGQAAQDKRISFELIAKGDKEEIEKYRKQYEEKEGVTLSDERIIEIARGMLILTAEEEWLEKIKKS